MTTAPGYDRPLYILPFDHRGTFLAKMLGAKGPTTAEQAAAIAAMKQVIYDGFRAALAGGVPWDKAGILVDEQFGADVLRDATAQGYTTALTVDVPPRRSVVPSEDEDARRLRRGVEAGELHPAGSPPRPHAAS
jgi:myo-inositol catabolism protein IolC